MERLRLRVDPIRCDGAGYCAELLPERVFLDDWGFPVVEPDPITDPSQLEHARRAVALCPRQALLLEDVRLSRR